MLPAVPFVTFMSQKQVIMQNNRRSYAFEELGSAPLFVDCVYESGPGMNVSHEVIPKLVACGNMGGFRIVNRRDPRGRRERLPAYVVLVTSMKEPEWPDFLDVETGVFHYYGDNREAGAALNSKPGNQLLERIFDLLHEGRFDDIPPFLIFRKTGRRRDVQFLGLAAPGNPRLSSDQDLVAFWRTMGNNRFQNYEAYFTVLDTGDQPISREWLNALCTDREKSKRLAPDVWLDFVERGRDGIHALKAPRIRHIPTREEQLACDTEQGRQCVQAIYQYFRDRDAFYGFEACAADIVSMMDSHFVDFTLTRPWRDGGRDALGFYKISTGAHVNVPLKIDFALEAKCYAMDNAVGVREMSRLISRIRYRQFGVMVTTAYVHKQAYEEVVDDGHPILIVTARDIARVLLEHSISREGIEGWIVSAQERYERLGTNA